MAQRMGMWVEIVSADPDDDRRDGYCQYDILLAHDEVERHCHWRRCVIAYAGAAAESIFYGGDPDSILFDRRDDLCMVTKIRETVNLPSAEWLEFRNKARSEALFRTVRREVEIVADSLQECRKLSGDQLRQLLPTLSQVASASPAQSAWLCLRRQGPL